MAKWHVVRSLPGQSPIPCACPRHASTAWAGTGSHAPSHSYKPCSTSMLAMLQVLGFQEIPRPELGFPGHWLYGLVRLRPPLCTLPTSALHA